MLNVDQNILPGMKPTFSCGQPLGLRVALHRVRNLIHHAQAHVADHLSDAADAMVPVTSAPGRSALSHVKLMYIFLGVWVPYSRSIIIPNVVVLVIGRHVV